MRASKEELTLVYKIAVLTAFAILSIWGVETGVLAGLLI